MRSLGRTDAGRPGERCTAPASDGQPSITGRTSNHTDHNPSHDRQTSPSTTRAGWWALTSAPVLWNSPSSRRATGSSTSPRGWSNLSRAGRPSGWAASTSRAKSPPLPVRRTTHLGWGKAPNEMPAEGSAGVPPVRAARTSTARTATRLRLPAGNRKLGTGSRKPAPRQRVRLTRKPRPAARARSRRRSTHGRRPPRARPSPAKGSAGPSPGLA